MQNFKNSSALIMGTIILTMGIALGYFAAGSKEQEPPETLDIQEIRVDEEAEPLTVSASERFKVTTVNIFECGHIIELDEHTTVTAQEAEALTKDMGGYDFELNGGKMALYREYGVCCPDHYYTEVNETGLSVYKTAEKTFEKTLICPLKVEAGNTYDELSAGMTFGSLEDINLYIEGMDE